MVPFDALTSPWQACGAPDKPVVPLAGLWCPWAQGEGHDPHDPPPPLDPPLHSNQFVTHIVSVYSCGEVKRANLHLIICVNGALDA